MQASDIEGIPTAPVSAFGDLENRIMSDIVRRIQINASVTRSADWQITRLKQLGESDAFIKKSIQTALSMSDQAINDIYAEAVKAEYIRNADLYKATGNVLTSFADNVELQSLMDAVKKQTKDEFLNISKSLGFVTQENGKLKALDITQFYQKTLDKAIGDISTGAFSYTESLRRTVKDMTNSGLRWIDYDSGYHNRVTVAARRATMTGFNQTMSHINERTAKDLDTDSFEITWHAGARPDHQWFQGKVFTKKELIDQCGLGTVEGLKGANCMHDYLPFVPGASVRTYTDAQLKQMNDAENVPKKYNGKEYTTSEALQRQRQLETNMRAQRQEISLLKQGGGDPLDIQNAMSRYQGSSAEYTGLSKAMGLPQQRERVTIDGLGSMKSVKEKASNIVSKVADAQKSELDIAYQGKIEYDNFLETMNKKYKKMYKQMTKDEWSQYSKLSRESIKYTDLVKKNSLASATDLAKNSTIVEKAVSKTLVSPEELKIIKNLDYSKMTKDEIANHITGEYDILRTITSNDDSLFEVGKKYDNRGKAESWLKKGGSFDPESSSGRSYVIYADKIPGHEVNYRNKTEVKVLDAFKEEGEVVVPSNTEMIVTRVSSEADYEEMGYYEVYVKLVKK